METSHIAFFTGYLTVPPMKFVCELKQILQFYVLYDPIIVFNNMNKLVEVMIIYRYTYAEVEHNIILSLFGHLIDIQMKCPLPDEESSRACIERLIVIQENFFELLLKTKEPCLYNALDVYSYLNKGKKHVYDFRPWLMTQANLKAFELEKLNMEALLKNTRMQRLSLEEKMKKLHGIYPDCGFLNNEEAGDIQYDYEFEKSKLEHEIMEMDMQIQFTEEKLKNIDIITEREKHMVLRTISKVFENTDQKRKRKRI